MTEPSPPPAVRASDAEREAVARVVRQAVGDGRLTLVEGDERLGSAYAAVFRADLEPVVADLGAVVPVGRSTPAAAAAGALPASAQPVTRPTSTGSVAVMSGSTRRGEWTPGRTHTAVAIMGGVELDLRHARLGQEGLAIAAVAIMGGITIDLRGAAVGSGPLTVQAYAHMGGVEIVVDEDTQVQEHGVGIMGGFDDESGPASGARGPVLHVTGLAVWGGVSVKRRPRLEPPSLSA